MLALANKRRSAWEARSGSISRGAAHTKMLSPLRVSAKSSSNLPSGTAAGEILTAVRHIPAREAKFAPMPEWVRAELAAAYAEKGVAELYSHQAAAAAAVHEGRNVVVMTPTASGKTLCYNLPVLERRAGKPGHARAVPFPYQGARAGSARRTARSFRAPRSSLRRIHLRRRYALRRAQGDPRAGHIVLSNPDMLHTGILPHHTRWQRLFENLRYVVLDELHTYRGVFGSHLANVLRRLRRIARFYGSDPQFICSSATIANPGELASRLAETEFEVIEENGAPAGEKFFIFYNPPVVNRFLGIRRSYINEASRVAQEFLKRKLQTIVFANSRLHTEVLLTYLQQANPAPPGQPPAIRGYRGGYLPGERREIERGLREGRIRGVVSTNALELGIDVGSLDATIMAGYPGTIASTWQRAGRAGRRSGSSCAVLVASSSPLDQFIVAAPGLFLRPLARARFRSAGQPRNPW